MAMALPVGIEPQPASEICDGSAWLETRPVVAADGVREWWNSQCDRDERTWTCYPAWLRRETEITAVVAGQSRNFTIQFDEHTSLDDIRKMTVYVVAILEEQVDRPKYCGYGKDDQIEGRLWRRLEEDLRTNVRKVELSARVSFEGGERVFLLTSNFIGFNFETDASAPNGYSIKCWSAYVIFT
jgi:hypothetical protein